MNYSLRELECFVAVAEELSFTRAAERLHLAQPPLSRHVRTLEEKIGTPLFSRSSRRVALTPTGALFYEETAPVLGRLRQAGETARRSAAGQTERLRIGFVSAVVSPDLVRVLKLFRERHPAVQLTVEDAAPAEQLAGLVQGRLDGGFVGLRPPEPTPGVCYTPWNREPLVCLVPSGHPLAAQASVGLRALAREAFLAVSSRTAPAFAEHVRSLCRKAGFRPRIILESPRAQAVAVMVAAGAGVALLPASLSRVVGSAAVALPLSGSPGLTHVFARPAATPSPAMAAFLRCLAANK